MKLSEELRACKGVHKVSTWMVELAQKIEAEADQLKESLRKANQRSSIFESNYTIQRGVVDTLKLELLNSADCILSRNIPDEVHAIACSMKETAESICENTSSDNLSRIDYLITKHNLLKETVTRLRDENESLGFENISQSIELENREKQISKLTEDLKQCSLDYCDLMEKYDEKCNEVYDVTIECCKLKHQIQAMKNEWEKSDAPDVTAEEKLERLVSLLYKPVGNKEPL